MKKNRKHLLITLCLLMAVCAVSIGGTIAWLTDDTNPVVNKFTPSDIEVDLTETLPANKTAKMVPGEEIAKNPKVIVKANSEESWVFVKIEKSDNFDTYMTFEVADGWTALTGVEGVYWRTHDATGASDATPISVLKDDKVTVKEGVTVKQMDALTDENAYPTLTFTAYIIQKAGSNDAASAWGKLNP